MVSDSHARLVSPILKIPHDIGRGEPIGHTLELSPFDMAVEETDVASQWFSATDMVRSVFPFSFYLGVVAVNGSGRIRRQLRLRRNLADRAGDVEALEMSWNIHRPVEEEHVAGYPGRGAI